MEFVHACILAKDCGPLLVPMNGSSNGHETTFPNSISFSCDLGFVMIGSQTRKCQSNGRWSGNETSCEGNSFVECILLCYTEILLFKIPSVFMKFI